MFSIHPPSKEAESLPLPKIEGDDRAQARALAIIYSHPVVCSRYTLSLVFGCNMALSLHKHRVQISKLILWLIVVDGAAMDQEEAIRLMNWNNEDPGFSLR